MRVRLYNYPLSPCGEKVRFALAEKGIAYEYCHVDLSAKENLAPGFLAMSPKGFVPVLLIDDAPLVESTVINEFVDDRWPEPSLKPSSAHDRATMRIWTKLVDERLHPAWPSIAWPILVRPAWLSRSAPEVEAMLASLPDPARRERQRRMYIEGVDSRDSVESVELFGEVCDRMNERLRFSSWLAGEQYSLADIALLPYLFAIDAFGMRAFFETGRPALADWYRRSHARSAWNGNLRSLFDSARLAQVEKLGIQAWDRINVNRRLRPETQE